MNIINYEGSTDGNAKVGILFYYLVYVVLILYVCKATFLNTKVLFNIVSITSDASVKVEPNSRILYEELLVVRTSG